MKCNVKPLQALFLCAAIAYTLLFVFMGFGNKMDPFFWLNKYRSLDSGWMTFGTVLTGHAWLAITGPHIVALRALGWLCCGAAMAVPYTLLLSNEQRRHNIHWLAITFLLMGYGAFQEFSTGTLTVLLFSALITCWMKYCEDRLPAWTLGLMAGLAIFARFPNVLVLAVLLPATALVGWARQKPWQRVAADLLIVLLVALAVEGIGWMLWKGLNTQTTLPPADNHTLVKMLTALWKKGMPLLIGCGGWMLFLLLMELCQRLPQAWQRWALSGLTALTAVCLLWGFVAPRQWYNNDFHHYIAALPLLLAAREAGRAARKGNWTGCLALLTAMGCLLVVPMGSDTAWLKLFPATLCLLPWLAPRLPQAGRYALPTLIGVALFAAHLYAHNSIGRQRLLDCDTWSQTALMRGICIREEEEQRMLQIQQDYEHYSQKRMVCMVGEDLHLMRALTGAPMPCKNEFWSNIYDRVYTKWYRQLVHEQHPIIFCSFTPSFILDKKTQTTKNSLLEQMLREEGYRVVNRSNCKYMIYIPQDTTLCTH